MSVMLAWRSRNSEQNVGKSTERQKFDRRKRVFDDGKQKEAGSEKANASSASAADLSSGGSVQAGVTNAPLQTTQHRQRASAQEANIQNSRFSAAKLALA